MLDKNLLMQFCFHCVFKLNGMFLGSFWNAFTYLELIFNRDGVFSVAVEGKLTYLWLRYISVYSCIFSLAKVWSDNSATFVYQSRWKSFQWAFFVVDGSNIIFYAFFTYIYSWCQRQQSWAGQKGHNCVVSVPHREKLKQLIEKRIGKENFVEKLGFITKHELYSRAAQKPQPVFPSPEQMLFDHEFTKLVKELEGPWHVFNKNAVI